jgi:hypothetical protein
MKKGRGMIPRPFKNALKQRVRSQTRNYHA